MNATALTRKKPIWFASPAARAWMVVIAFLAVFLALPIYLSLSLLYTETKGPFKNWNQPVDLDGDGDLDVLVSHTRWEEEAISWAGIGRWINQGDGTFELASDASRPTGVPLFGGFAGAAGDLDQDGDQDIFRQDWDIHLLVNQGGLQAGQSGRFEASGAIHAPEAYSHGYRDMGGTISLGDLNGDGRLDAFIAGCCYGLDPGEPDNNLPYAPAVSWLWLNDGRPDGFQTGQTVPLDELNGRPIRQAAAGDLDGDGDNDILAAVGRPTLGTAASPADLILLNDGAGNLSVFDQALGQTDSTAVALGDVNGDGRLDALVGTDSGATLWLNQGPAGEALFAAGQSFAVERSARQKLGAAFSAAADRVFGLYLPYGSLRTTAVFLEDLDGDGDLDALLGRLWAAEIWWNDGTGAFERGEASFSYGQDTGLALADFDGDGDKDLFAAGNGPGYRLWWNDGAGLFAAGG